MPRAPFSPVLRYKVIKPFRWQGKSYVLGSDFDVETMAISDRDIRKLYESRRIGLPSEVGNRVKPKPEAKSGQETDSKASTDGADGPDGETEPDNDGAEEPEDQLSDDAVAAIKAVFSGPFRYDHKGNGKYVVMDSKGSVIGHGVAEEDGSPRRLTKSVARELVKKLNA